LRSSDTAFPFSEPVLRHEKNAKKFLKKLGFFVEKT